VISLPRSFFELFMNLLVYIIIFFFFFNTGYRSRNDSFTFSSRFRCKSCGTRESIVFFFILMKSIGLIVSVRCAFPVLKGGRRKTCVPAQISFCYKSKIKKNMYILEILRGHSIRWSNSQALKEFRGKRK